MSPYPIDQRRVNSSGFAPKKANYVKNLVLSLIVFGYSSLSYYSHAMDWHPSSPETEDPYCDLEMQQLMFASLTTEAEKAEEMTYSPSKNKEPSSKTKDNSSPLKRPRTSADSSLSKKLEEDLEEKEEGELGEINDMSMPVGIARRNLDYVYKGQAFSTYQWHIQSGTALQEIKSRQGPDEESTNFLRARLEGLFYNVEKSDFRKVNHEINYTFTSKHLDRTESEPGNFPFLSMSQLISGSTKPEKAKKRRGKLLGAAPFNSIQEEKGRHNHTEISALLYILEKDDWLEPFLKASQKYSSPLSYFVISLCSYYDPCLSCSSSFFLTLQPESYFKRKIIKKWSQSLRGEPTGEEEEESFGVFIGISSLKEYHSSRYFWGVLYADNIQLEGFSQLSHFAQMPLEIGLESCMESPPYTTRLFIRSSTSNHEEDHRKLVQALEEKDYQAQAALYFKSIFNDSPGSKQIRETVRAMTPNLIQLAEYRPDITKSQVSQNMEEFICKFTQKQEEQEKLTASQEIEWGPADILDYLAEYLISSMAPGSADRVIKTHFKKTEGSTKGQRDKILATYLNKDRSDIKDTAYLLKLYGFLYLRDSIPERYIPEALKKNKKKVKPRAAKEEDLLTELTRMQGAYHNGSPLEKIGKVAHLLEKKMRTGVFSTVNKKYYWKEK